ncbi:hypothetical protein GCM10010345_63480 [Streptomyces canarius]|uniref:Integral membrane protein n=1 Tax=Streptomyces canarius TaxID=285453 RepID=A0ABQ3D0Q4_9ACTN|nr:hypothetical protein GCM10010345_63480 [Streptomyces canarius]
MSEGDNGSQIKHLEFIQSTVTRLANNSFLIRGWSITLTGALVGVAVSSERPSLALASLIPTIGFWLLDFFYLRQERLFRKLYSAVAQSEPGVPSFSMDVAPYRELVTHRGVILSPTLCLFYIPLLLIDVAALILS